MRHPLGITVITIATAVVLSGTAAAQRVAPPTPTFGAGSGGSRPSAQSRSIPPPPPQAPPGANVPQAPPSAAPVGIAQLPPMSGIAAPLLSPAGSTDVFRARPRTYAPRYDRRSNRSRVLDSFGYLTGVAGYYPGAEYQGADTVDRPEAAPDFGFLRLNVQPYSAEVYVDGFYVSTVGDFSGTAPARAIQAGPHRVELRAEGHETATFDVRIVPNETITYRRELAKADNVPQQARSVPPAMPKTFYVIPKCYAGDKRPTAEQLPKGCRASNVRAVPPVLNRAK